MQQFQHGGLQGVNGRCGTAGNQVVVGIVEQGNAVENGGVVDQDLVNLLVDRALGTHGVKAGHFGDETHVVVDKRLAGHAELAAKGVDLALGKQFRLGGVGFQFAVFTHAQELTGTAGQIAVILGGLKVAHAALGGPQLERGGDLLVHLDNVLADRVVQDRGKRRGGVEELAASLVPQVVLAHTQQGGGGAHAVAGHALNGQIAQGVAAHFLRTLGGVLNVRTGPQQHGVHSCLAEVVALVAVHTAGNRGAVFQQIVHRRLSYGVHGGAVADILRGIHARLTAQRGNVAHALALRGDGLAGGLGGLCALLAVIVAHTAGAAGGILTALALAALGGGIVARRVDLALQAVKLCSFLCRQVTASGAGAAHNSLLTGDHFLNGHGCFASSMIKIFVDLDLLFINRKVLGRRLLRVVGSAHAHGGVRRHGNNGHLQRRPFAGDLAGACKTSVRGGLTGHHFLPAVHAVTHGRGFQGAGFDFAENLFGVIVRVELHFGHAAVVLHPCADHFSHHLVGVVVEKQNAHVVQAGEIQRVLRVIQDFHTKPTAVWLLAGKADRAPAAVLLALCAAVGLNVAHASLPAVSVPLGVICLRCSSVLLSFHFQKLHLLTRRRRIGHIPGPRPFH